MPGTWTHEFKTDLFKGSAQVNTGLFINGKFVDPVDGETIECVPLPCVPPDLS